MRRKVGKCSITQGEDLRYLLPPNNVRYHTSSEYVPFHSSAHIESLSNQWLAWKYSALQAPTMCSPTTRPNQESPNSVKPTSSRIGCETRDILRSIPCSILQPASHMANLASDKWMDMRHGLNKPGINHSVPFLVKEIAILTPAMWQRA